MLFVKVYRQALKVLGQSHPVVEDRGALYSEVQFRSLADDRHETDYSVEALKKSGIPDIAIYLSMFIRYNNINGNS